MVELPAQAAGLELETGLAETLTDDAGEEPGLLPLLSTSLMQLWERRRGAGSRTPTTSPSADFPGQWRTSRRRPRQPARGRAWNRARGAVRLAGRASTGEVVRRRVALAELEGLPGNAGEVVASLAGARLLTLVDEWVEAAHESLFREWPRLAGWLADDESTRTVLHRLAVAAGQWETTGRDPGLLWRGAGLQSALDVMTAYPDETTASERDFLAQEALLDRERRDAEQRATQRDRQNRTLRTMLGLGSALLVLAVVAGLLAVVSRQQAAHGPATDSKRPRSRQMPADWPPPPSTRNSWTSRCSRPWKRCAPSRAPRPMVRW